MFKPAETSSDGKSLNISGSDYDLYDLNRKLDITKSKVFMGNSAAFLGPLMSMMAFIWSEEVPTAATNGKTFWWNPVWFLSLDPKVRETVLVHELWHVARLHMVRLGERNPKIWNYACVPFGTKIGMADGSEKSIEIVEAGDLIKNIKDGTSTVAQRINSTYKEILEIEFEDGRILRCSEDHEVLTENGFTLASQLTIGSSCFVDRRYGKISEVELGNHEDTGYS